MEKKMEEDDDEKKERRERAAINELPATSSTGVKSPHHPTL